MPDRVGGRARQEMTAFDQRIRRGHQDLTRSRRQQGSVVAHAEQDVAAPRTAREVAGDDVELTEGHGCSGVRAVPLLARRASRRGLLLGRAQLARSAI